MSVEAGESQRSKGGDGLRRARTRQLTFAFADSPSGGTGAGTPDVSGGKAYLLLTAKGKRAGTLAARTSDTSRLLERAASEPNLAKALLNVARNKGAPGLDGQTVSEVVAQSAKLLPKLRRALLEGTYRPDDIRRVWIPKPGGGQRGLGIPTVVDRWVEQAVLQVLEPIYDPTFHPSSHGFRRRRGAHTAVAEAKAYIEQGYTVVVDLDLSKFLETSSYYTPSDETASKRLGWFSNTLIRRPLRLPRQRCTA
jgi:RNA-directed DNA polymerase